MGRSSMQGTPWHVVNRWELKSKDEFEWESTEKTSRKRTKKHKKKNNTTNHVEMAKKQAQKLKANYSGSFVVKFDGELEEEFVIGKNISNEAELVKLVYNSETGKIIKINTEQALLISKNIK